MNRKIIIVEDAPFCSVLVKKMIVGLPFEIKRIEHVDELKTIDPLRDGDIILLDLIGTGSETLGEMDKDVRVIRMSSNQSLNPDLVKPFFREELMKVLYPQNEKAS